MLEFTKLVQVICLIRHKLLKFSSQERWHDLFNSIFLVWNLVTFIEHSLWCTKIIHPRKMIAVTSSDDKSWKMWTIPDGQMIMRGDGHTDWVSGVDFHPKYLDI